MDHFDQDERKRKLVFTGVIVTLVVLLAAVFVLLLHQSKQTAVDIFVVPSDAQVTVDGKHIDAGKVHLSKGKHTFVGKRQYFTAATVQFDTNQNDTGGVVYIALRPSGSEGQAYLAAHPDENLRYERVSGAQFSSLQNKLYTQYPLTASLPYLTTDYKINYLVNNDKTVTYTVELYPRATAPGTSLYKQQLAQFKAAALGWLKDEGIDTPKASIQFSPDPDAQ